MVLCSTIDTIPVGRLLTHILHLLLHLAQAVGSHFCYVKYGEYKARNEPKDYYQNYSPYYYPQYHKRQR